MAWDMGLGGKSNRMMVLLADEGPLKTSALRERLGFDRNQSVNYRGKRVLGSGKEDDDPALGFVENDGDGMGTSTELSWWLTELGQQWVRQHRDKLEAPQDAKEAIEVVQELQDEVESLRGRVQQTEGTLSQLKKPVTSKEKATETPAVSIRENGYAIRNQYDRLKKHKATVEDLEAKVERFGERLSNIEDVLLEPERER